MNLKLINNSDEKKYIRFFKVNMQQEIKPWNYIEITTQSDEEKDYYETISKELGIEVEGSEPQPTWGYEKEFVNLDKFLNFTIRATKEVVDAGSGDIEILYINASTSENKKAVYFLPLADYVCYDQAGDLNNYGYDNTTEEGLDAFAQQIIDAMVVEDDLSISVSQQIIYTNNLGLEYYIGRAELSATHKQVKEQSALDGLEMHITNTNDLYTSQIWNNSKMIFIGPGEDKYFNYSWPENIPINENNVTNQLANVINWSNTLVVEGMTVWSSEGLYAGMLYIYVNASQYDNNDGIPYVYVEADNENLGYDYGIRTINIDPAGYTWTQLNESNEYTYSSETTTMDIIFNEYKNNLFNNVLVAEWQEFKVTKDITYGSSERVIGNLIAFVGQETAIRPDGGVVDITILNTISEAPYLSIKHPIIDEVAYPGSQSGWGYAMQDITQESLGEYLQGILSELIISSCEGPYEKISYKDDNQEISIEVSASSQVMTTKEGQLNVFVNNLSSDYIIKINATDYTQIDDFNVYPNSPTNFSTNTLTDITTSLVDTVAQQILDNSVLVPTNE